MIDPEFQRILWRVVLAGGAIGIIGAAVLFFAFRAFGAEKPSGRPVMLLSALVGFVMLCCAALFLVAHTNGS